MWGMMARIFSDLSTSAVMVVVLGLACGCSRGPAVGTIEGDVTLDGQPLAKGHLEFTPVDGQSQTAGAIIENGKFTATVPVTKMQVRIRSPKVVGKRLSYGPGSPLEDEVAEALPAKYNEKSDLTLDVQKGKQEVRYDLKSK